MSSAIWNREHDFVLRLSGRPIALFIRVLFMMADWTRFNGEEIKLSTATGINNNHCTSTISQPDDDDEVEPETSQILDKDTSPVAESGRQIREEASRELEQPKSSAKRRSSLSKQATGVFNGKPPREDKEATHRVQFNKQDELQPSSPSISTSSSSNSEDNSSLGQFCEPRAPDGGWGWVVVAASFMVNLIADGVTFSFGVIYVEFLNYFGEGKSKTAWIGSLFMAMPMLSGPIAGFLTDR